MGGWGVGSVAMGCMGTGSIKAWKEEGETVEDKIIESERSVGLHRKKHGTNSASRNGTAETKRAVEMA